MGAVDNTYLNMKSHQGTSSLCQAYVWQGSELYSSLTTIRYAAHTYKKASTSLEGDFIKT